MPLPSAFRYARLGVAVLCAAGALQVRPFSGLVSLCAAFVLYSIAVLLWHGEDSGPASLGLILLDTIFFLAWLAGPGGDRLVSGAVFVAYLILSAAMLHSWRETVLAGGVPVLFLWILWRPVAPQLIPCMIVGAVVGMLLSAQRQALRRNADGVEKEIESWRLDAERAAESERQRIAADFHDGPLQSFISFQMRLQIVKTMLKRDASAGMAELEQLQELCRSQVAELRTFIRGMRPPDEDGAGLLITCGRLIDLFQKDTGILSTFHRGAPLGTEDPESSTEVLQLIREALNNIQKHSKASRAAISVGRVENSLEVTVEDDGTGFPFAGVYTLEELDALGIGPVSVKRRVRTLCGELTIDSRPGHGAALRIRIPL